MPLYRRHRGGLQESLDTTIIVKDLEDLRIAILDNWSGWDPANIKNFKIQIIQPSMYNNLDTRCGWYTHYVTTDINQEGTFMVEGMLSEPMKGDI